MYPPRRLMLGQPALHCLRDKLWAIVTTQIGRRAVACEQTRQHSNHSLGWQRRGHLERQPFTRILVHHRQDLQLRAVAAGIIDKIVPPDVARIGRLKRDAPARFAAPFASMLANLEPRLLPEPLHPLFVDQSLAAQQRTNTPIAIPWMPLRQLLDTVEQVGSLVWPRLVVIC